MLIITTEDFKVIKAIEGSGSRYIPHGSETVFDCNVRPATDEDIKTGIKELGLAVDVDNKTTDEVKDDIITILQKHGNIIANGHAKWDDDKFYTEWYYEIAN